MGGGGGGGEVRVGEVRRGSRGRGKERVRMRWGRKGEEEGKEGGEGRKNL